jgi:Ca-activated chloride channel family protein
MMQLLEIAEAIQAGDVADGPTATADPDATDDPAATTEPSASDPPRDQAPLVAAILLSDGANSVGAAQPLDAAERAAAVGVPIYTIALGTEAGVVTVEDEFGFPITLEVPPDRETLARIAELTDATAFDAPTAGDLTAVYDDLQSRIGFVEESQEVSSWFAGAALLLVVAAAGLSVLWFGRLP